LSDLKVHRDLVVLVVLRETKVHRDLVALQVLEDRQDLVVLLAKIAVYRGQVVQQGQVVRKVLQALKVHRDLVALQVHLARKVLWDSLLLLEELYIIQEN
jgi:hypothetical protein